MVEVDEGSVADQVMTDRYSIWNGCCIEGMQKLPKECIGFSVYSPPFAKDAGGLYTYSSHEKDLSNCKSYAQFFEHYEYVVREIHRLTPPGRLTAVHCMDVPRSNTGRDSLIDFPGDIIRLHEKVGFELACRHFIWKEPLAVRNRTMQHNLAHMTVVQDSSMCGVASADQLLILRKKGENKVPVIHPTGLHNYAGERQIPSELMSYRGWTGKQTENRLSHWIWRQYASSFWDDIRMQRVMPFEAARDSDDEKHCHALQLDVIERAVILRSNPDEVVLTPFMGVGSEVYGAVELGRKGIGFELKPSYFRQSVKNLRSIGDVQKNQDSFAF